MLSIEMVGLITPPSCISRTGGAMKSPLCLESLPIIAVDETVHDLPEDPEPSPVEQPANIPPAFPTPLRVQCEEDLIGRRAFIVYEDSLQQLASFLLLPVERCPYRCVPPLLCERGCEWVNESLL